jgi:hypothetical protein
MALSLWNPMSELDRLQRRLDRLFEVLRGQSTLRVALRGSNR